MEKKEKKIYIFKYTYKYKRIWGCLFSSEVAMVSCSGRLPDCFLDRPVLPGPILRKIGSEKACLGIWTTGSTGVRQAFVWVPRFFNGKFHCARLSTAHVGNASWIYQTCESQYRIAIAAGKLTQFSMFISIYFCHVANSGRTSELCKPSNCERSPVGIWRDTLHHVHRNRKISVVPGLELA